jgi:uncharacterized membrane protein YdjX (TVP38/TMEM64 family)
MSRARHRLLFGLVGIGIVSAAVYFFDVVSVFRPEIVTEEIARFGVLAPVVFIAVYVCASVLFVPGTPLTLLAGVLFGSVYGVVYTVIGATLGAVAMFCVSRFFGRSIFAEYVVSRAVSLQRYDTHIARNGFMTVLLLRFIPLFPFNGLNVAFGLTAVRFSDYVLGTVLGIIPGSIAYVVLGHSIGEMNVLYSGLALFGIVGIAVIGHFVAKRYHT